MIKLNRIISLLPKLSAQFYSINNLRYLIQKFLNYGTFEIKAFRIDNIPKEIAISLIFPYKVILWPAPNLSAKYPTYHLKKIFSFFELKTISDSDIC